MAREHSGDEEGDETSGEGEAHGADGPRTAGSQEVLRDLEADLVVGVRLGAQGTGDTQGLVLGVADLQQETVAFLIL